MPRLSREAYVDYSTALEQFAKLRKEMNDYIANEDMQSAKKLFDGLKYYAAGNESVAMDLLAYYYKSGVKGLVAENYKRYIQWEVLAASRGNELAIEKLQFLIGYACDAILDDSEYDLIEYKNDIDDDNALYVIGKNLCKVIARDFMKVYPVELAQEQDEPAPYTKEDFIIIRQMIDEAIPVTLKTMKS